MDGNQQSRIDEELMELELGGQQQQQQQQNEDDDLLMSGLNEINIIPAASSSVAPSLSSKHSNAGKSSYYGCTDTVYSSPGQRIYNTSSSRQRSRQRIRGGTNGRIRRQQQQQQQINSGNGDHSQYANNTYDNGDGLSEYKQYLRGSTNATTTNGSLQNGYSHTVDQVSEQLARCKHIARQYPQIAAGTMLAFGLMMIGFVSLIMSSTTNTHKVPLHRENNNNPMDMMRNIVDGPQLKQVGHQIVVPIDQQEEEDQFPQDEGKVLEYRRHDLQPQQQPQEIQPPPQQQPGEPIHVPQPEQHVESPVADAPPLHVVDGDALAELLHAPNPVIPENHNNNNGEAAAAVGGGTAATESGLVVDAMTYFRGDHTDYLPHHFQHNFANVWELPSPSSSTTTDLPFFWHIPKSGGTTVADILTHCLSLVSASKIGATEGHGNEGILQVNTYADKGKYVNVDTATLPGIQRAKQLGLAASGLADVMVTHRLQETGLDIFDAQHKARVFCMFRHPVRRGISMFYYLQRATWEPTYDPTLASMTLEQYAHSPKAESNWVTRFLTKEYTDKITDQHLDLAKQIMRSKMVIGILEDFDNSIKRFELYFGWWNQVVKHDPEQSIRCQQRKTAASHNKVQYPDVLETDPGYQRLEQINWADLYLYDYALELFEEQKVLVNGKESIM